MNQDEIAGDLERSPTPEKKPRVSFENQEEDEEQDNKQGEDNKSESSDDTVDLGTDLISPGAESTNSSNFSFQHINAEDAGEESEREEVVDALIAQVEDLEMSSMMKKTKTKSPLVWKANLPCLLTKWKDTRDRNLVTIEMHLPSGSIPDDFDMQLKMRGGSQFFVFASSSV